MLLGPENPGPALLLYRTSLEETLVLIRPRDPGYSLIQQTFTTTSLGSELEIQK